MEGWVRCIMEKDVWEGYARSVALGEELGSRFRRGFARARGR